MGFLIVIFLKPYFWWRNPALSIGVLTEIIFAWLSSWTSNSESIFIVEILVWLRLNHAVSPWDIPAHWPNRLWNNSFLICNLEGIWVNDKAFKLVKSAREFEECDLIAWEGVVQLIDDYLPIFVLSVMFSVLSFAFIVQPLDTSEYTDLVLPINLARIFATFQFKHEFLETTDRVWLSLNPSVIRTPHWILPH